MSGYAVIGAQRGQRCEVSLKLKLQVLDSPGLSAGSQTWTLQEEHVHSAAKASSPFPQPRSWPDLCRGTDLTQELSMFSIQTPELNKP